MMRGQGFWGKISLKQTAKRSLAALGLGLTGLLMFAVFFPARAHRLSFKLQRDDEIKPLATTFTVNSTSDPGGAFVSCTTRGGECTLRAAIDAANATAGDDTISFGFSPLDLGCSAGRCTINLTSPLPSLSTNININGPGADLLTVRRNSGTLFGILKVTAGTIIISGMTIRDGAVPGGAGGGISNVQGIVFVNNCVVTANSADVGGGIVNSTGNMSITNSTITGNTGNQGGGVNNNVNATMAISGSTISNNIAKGLGGGGFVNLTTATISNSVISGNSADTQQGGGILNEGQSLNITGTTISGNTAARGAGIYNGFAVNLNNCTINNNAATQDGGAIDNINHAILNLSNSTVSGNAGAPTGGLLNEGDQLGFSVKSSIIANNGAGSSDVKGLFTTAGFNLIGKRDGSTGFTAPTDLTGTTAAPLDPKLDVNGLQDNGGPTKTIALNCGSPAIDKASSVSLNGSLSTDQRGTGFPRTFDDATLINAVGGDGTDMGAFERQQTCASPTPTPTPNVVQFSSSNYSVQEDCTTVTITVNRIGDTSGVASVDYNTSDITATERKDYIKALGTLRFAAGETSKSFAVLINEDSFVEGSETFSITLSNPSGVSLGGPVIATVTITDDAGESTTNPIDDPQNFVCQHYHDFLNRQPDAPGLQFWTNQITSCGSDAACLEARRINVSASFFLSIEFQDTGYLVERIYKTAFGDATGTSTFLAAHQLTVPVVRLNEFLADTQDIAQGIIVGQGNWEQQIENNKQVFTAAFVQRSRFITAFPTTMTAAQFVDKLNANAGNPLSQSERDQLVNDLATNAKNRAQVLRAVAEDHDLNLAESNRAFVLMQYFGYLRRNPNDPQDADYTGYDFWLTKLNQFNGNFINAEMVKAFITSIEYRQRFGP